MNGQSVMWLPKKRELVSGCQVSHGYIFSECYPSRLYIRCEINPASLGLMVSCWTF